MTFEFAKRIEYEEVFRFSHRSVVEVFEWNDVTYHRNGPNCWEYVIGSSVEIVSPDLEAKLEAQYQQWLVTSKVNFTSDITLYDAGSMWCATCEHPTTCDRITEVHINPLQAVQKLLEAASNDIVP